MIGVAWFDQQPYKKTLQTIDLIDTYMPQ